MTVFVCIHGLDTRCISTHQQRQPRTDAQHASSTNFSKNTTMDSLRFLNTLKTGWIARPARGFLLLLLPRRQGEGWRAAILYNDGGAGDGLGGPLAGTDDQILDSRNQTIVILTITYMFCLFYSDTHRIVQTGDGVGENRSLGRGERRGPGLAVLRQAEPGR